MNQVAIQGSQALFQALHMEDTAGNWLQPTAPSPAMLAQARAILADFPARLAPAEPAAVRKWLISLGALCAGRMPLDEAERRVAAYVALIEQPAGVFTKNSLARVAGAFQWFPAFAELKPALDAEALRLRKEYQRLQRLLQPPAITAGPRLPPSAESIAARARAMQEAGLA
ncbi:hypothetical protein FNB15_18265 [Ferrovibrio terrae]|uniref:Uncharacterized protein n=1 Tax=Ferrovibrio terrae TaxID=2594003 RepID=A0A516H5M0_9PROT|nr:hypothetical protein [Ferrovibrio terrae]QDO99094.1 hypothetical protein FNB15_18265 [Ferrovibrio terrae]